MGEELSIGIALCTAWDSDDTKSWAHIVAENALENPTDFIGQLSHIAVQLARARASEDNCGVTDVLHHLALDGLNDDGRPTS